MSIYIMDQEFINPEVCLQYYYVDPNKHFIGYVVRKAHRAIGRELGKIIREREGFRKSKTITVAGLHTGLQLVDGVNENVGVGLRIVDEKVMMNTDFSSELPYSNGRISSPYVIVCLGYIDAQYTFDLHELVNQYSDEYHFIFVCMETTVEAIKKYEDLTIYTVQVVDEVSLDIEYQLNLWTAQTTPEEAEYSNKKAAKHVWSDQGELCGSKHPFAGAGKKES